MSRVVRQGRRREAESVSQLSALPPVVLGQTKRLFLSLQNLNTLSIASVLKNLPLPMRKKSWPLGKLAPYPLSSVMLAETGNSQALGVVFAKWAAQHQVHPFHMILLQEKARETVSGIFFVFKGLEISTY